MKGHASTTTLAACIWVLAPCWILMVSRVCPVWMIKIILERRENNNCIPQIVNMSFSLVFKWAVTATKGPAQKSKKNFNHIPRKLPNHLVWYHLNLQIISDRRGKHLRWTSWQTTVLAQSCFEILKPRDLFRSTQLYHFEGYQKNRWTTIQHLQLIGWWQVSRVFSCCSRVIYFRPAYALPTPCLRRCGVFLRGDYLSWFAYACLRLPAVFWFCLRGLRVLLLWAFCWS